MSGRFLVTEECGRLARWIRLMGHDTVTMAAQPLSELYRRAYTEHRIVITRKGRVRASSLFRVVQLQHRELEAQLKQLVRELRLPVEPANAFTRCDVCNLELEPVPKDAVQARVPAYVFETQTTFHRCVGCRRIYWAATHWERALRLFDRLREEVRHA